MNQLTIDFLAHRNHELRNLIPSIKTSIDNYKDLLEKEEKRLKDAESELDQNHLTIEMLKGEE